MMIFLLVALIALAVLIFFGLAGYSLATALVNNSAAILNQKKHTLADGWNAGILNFWPVFSYKTF